MGETERLGMTLPVRGGRYLVQGMTGRFFGQEEFGTMARRRSRKIVPLTKYTPEHVKAVRASTGLSQSLFALALGVTPMTVRNWEQGRIEPRGVATRVLDLIEQDSSIVEYYVSK